MAVAVSPEYPMANGIDEEIVTTGRVMRWRSSGSSAEHSHASDSQEAGGEEVDGGSKLEQRPKSSIKEVNDVTLSDDEAPTLSLSTSEIATAEFRQIHLDNLPSNGRCLEGNLPVNPVIPNAERCEDRNCKRRRVTSISKMEVEGGKISAEPGEESEDSVVTRERCGAPSGIWFAMDAAAETRFTFSRQPEAGSEEDAESDYGDSDGEDMKRIAKHKS